MHTLYSILLTLMLFLAPAQSWAAATIETGGGALGGLPSPYGSEGTVS